MTQQGRWGSFDDPSELKWLLDVGNRAWLLPKAWPEGPSGSVFLIEAIDLVGKTMWRHHWCTPPFDLSEEEGGPPLYYSRLAAAAQFGLTMNVMAEAFEKGEVAIAFQSEDVVDGDRCHRGEMQPDTWRWYERETWRSCFIIGGYFKPHDHHPPKEGGDGDMYWLFVRRSDLNRFIKRIQIGDLEERFKALVEGLEELSPRAIEDRRAESDAQAFEVRESVERASQPKGRRGRKPNHDWEEGILYLEQRLWPEKGDPEDRQNWADGWKSDSDIARHVLEHMAKHEPDIEPPEISTVSKKLRPVLARLRRK